MEEKVEEIFLKHGGGPDNLIWIIEDYYSDQPALISLSRSTGADHIFIKATKAKAPPNV